MPSVPSMYEEPKALASYILWSSLLAEGGNLKRPGMLMSKNWMER